MDSGWCRQYIKCAVQNWVLNYVRQLSYSFFSKLQTEIALSTAEAEYIALSQALREVIPLMSLMEEINTTFPVLLGAPEFICTVHEDNQSCIKMAQTDKLSPCTKQIALKYHHFRSFIKSKWVTIKYYRTKCKIGHTQKTHQWCTILPSSSHVNWMVVCPFVISSILMLRHEGVWEYKVIWIQYKDNWILWSVLCQTIDSERIEKIFAVLWYVCTWNLFYLIWYVAYTCACTNIP